MKQLLSLLLTFVFFVSVLSAQTSNEVPDTPQPQVIVGEEWDDIQDAYINRVHIVGEPHRFVWFRRHPLIAGSLIGGAIGVTVALLTRHSCSHYPPGYNGQGVDCPKPDKDDK